MRPTNGFEGVERACQQWLNGDAFKVCDKDALQSVEHMFLENTGPPELQLFMGLSWYEHGDAASAGPYFVRALKSPHMQDREEYRYLDDDSRWFLHLPLTDVLNKPLDEAALDIHQLLQMQLNRDASILAHNHENAVKRELPRQIPVSAAVAFLKQRYISSQELLQGALFFADALCTKNFLRCLFPERPSVSHAGFIYPTEVEGGAKEENQTRLLDIHEQLLSTAFEVLSDLGELKARKVVQREPAWLASTEGQDVTEHRMATFFCVKEKGTVAFRRMNKRIRAMLRR